MEYKWKEVQEGMSVKNRLGRNTKRKEHGTEGTQAGRNTRRKGRLPIF
jgi:hypothetical protein